MALVQELENALSFFASEITAFCNSLAKKDNINTNGLILANDRVLNLFQDSIFGF